MSDVVAEERIEWLSGEGPGDGQYVVYWMQASQRAHMNHALEFAVQQANEIGKALWVVFGLMPDYPEANARHYFFMLQGLQSTEDDLAKRNIRLIVRLGDPVKIAIEAAEKAALVVCDKGYLRHQRAWREALAKESKAPVVLVESDVVVPVEVASDKHEYAARTIRPKIHKQLDKFLVELKSTKLNHNAFDLSLPESQTLDDPAKLVSGMKIDQSVKPVPLWEGGRKAGLKVLDKFIESRLKRYVSSSKHPESNDISYMSLYLHFGQISPLEIALAIESTRFGTKEAKDSYLEELIVRRELAINFVYFNDKYDRFDALPQWAKATLKRHADDKREHRYTPAELDAAETHDPYWNAAMREMKYTGFMHNYMRMYWGKKILEWSASPQRAYRAAIEFNNRYFIDGRDPNSYGNVLWLFGLHDRPWTERAIFGTIRYMNANGLKRKCDPDAYVAKVDGLIDEIEGRTFGW